MDGFFRIFFLIRLNVAQTRVPRNRASFRMSNHNRLTSDPDCPFVYNDVNVPQMRENISRVSWNKSGFAEWRNSILLRYSGHASWHLGPVSRINLKFLHRRYATITILYKSGIVGWWKKKKKKKNDDDDSIIQFSVTISDNFVAIFVRKDLSIFQIEVTGKWKQSSKKQKWEAKRKVQGIPETRVDRVGGDGGWQKKRFLSVPIYLLLFEER